MPLTERKAIGLMFEELQEEKRRLKQEYRNDLADIETRQERLLDRLKRLDDVEREAIDAEGILEQMAETSRELAALIPDVPAEHLLNKAAEKLAEQAKEENAAQIIPAKQEEAAPKEAAPKEEPVIQEATRPKSTEDVITAIEDILKEKGPLKMRMIEQELKERHGWQWGNFMTSFSKWRTKYKNRIGKKGHTYHYEEIKKKPNETKKPASNINSINDYNTSIAAAYKEAKFKKEGVLQ